jgi:1,2-dihydroxy-3-keto-5-methylthiopentene dioxygenase
MAVVRIPEENRSLHDIEQIHSYLANIGIDYERWESAKPLPADASADDILGAYSEQIAQLKNKGGYTTADVIDIKPDLPGLDAMLARFNIEHWHDEDEVRYIIAGRGLFHLHPSTGPVIAVEVEAGDLIRVPKGTLHWFDLCGDRRIRAIRLFQNQSGWTPNYTNSAVDRKYEPVCLGPAYIPQQRDTR